MLTVRDIPKEAKLVSDSQDIKEIQDRINHPLIDDYGCVFVLYNEAYAIEAVWGVESNIPMLHYGVDVIPLAFTPLA